MLIRDQCLLNERRTCLGRGNSGADMLRLAAMGLGSLEHVQLLTGLHQAKHFLSALQSKTKCSMSQEGCSFKVGCSSRVRQTRFYVLSMFPTVDLSFEEDLEAHFLVYYSELMALLRGTYLCLGHNHIVHLNTSGSHIPDFDSNLPWLDIQLALFVLGH